MKRPDALEHFHGKSRYNCAQAVLKAYAPLVGLEDICLERFSHFGSGKAPEGECGALFAAKSVFQDLAVKQEIENEFIRAVDRDGNKKAQALVAEVFELRDDFEWRGLGTLPHSALRLRETYAAFDAERRFACTYRPVADHQACECGIILRGLKRPQDCALFGNVCTPETPVGSCMVSSEGACAAHYTYGRYRDG